MRIVVIILDKYKFIGIDVPTIKTKIKKKKNINIS